MPELPEVHTISKDMDIHLQEFTIENVAIEDDYKGIHPDSETFIKGVVGKKIESVERIAKFIVVELDSGNYIVFHLAMTGRILLRDPDYKEDNYVRVLFELERFAVKKHLRFLDMRKFGKVQFLNRFELDKLRLTRGIDPLDETLRHKNFLEKIKSVRTNIKNVLLNQKVFAGIGNIYANEALHRAGIHPETPTKEMSLEEAEKLLESIRYVLNQGIENRGSTLPDRMYVDLFGKEGTHQENFKIYMQEKCINCQTDIKYIKLNGRGTYFCPTCQSLDENN